MPFTQPYREALQEHGWLRFSVALPWFSLVPNIISLAFCDVFDIRGLRRWSCISSAFAPILFMKRLAIADAHVSQHHPSGASHSFHCGRLEELQGSSAARAQLPRPPRLPPRKLTTATSACAMSSDRPQQCLVDTAVTQRLVVK